MFEYARADSIAAVFILSTSNFRVIMIECAVLCMMLSRGIIMEVVLNIW